MSASWLFENFNQALFGSNIFEGSDREVGNAFVPLTNGRIVAMRWCRANNDGVQKPTILRVWDTTTAAVVYSMSPVPDSAGLGWKANAVAEVPQVIAGRKYIVSSAWQTNRQHTLYGLGDVPPPNFPMQFWTPAGRITNDPAIGFPGNNNSGYVYGVDVRVRSQQPPLTFTSQGSVVFDTDAKYMVPANMYTLTLTTAPAWSSSQVVVGMDTRRIVGAWWPIVSGQLGERRLIDALVFNMFLAGLTLMDGVLITTTPGTLGTLEAKTVDDVV
jgi:hypothetical protein